MPQPKSSSGASKARKPAARKPAAKKASSARKPAASKPAAKRTAASSSSRKPASKPTPKPSASRGSSRSGPVADAAANVAALRELLARGVVITTERLQEAVDDAVTRGRMTRTDAEELVQSLVSAGRQQTQDVLADIESLVGAQRKRAVERTERAADRVLVQADRARRLAGLGSNFPVTGYDELTASQINDRLPTLSPAELRKVRDYERRNGNRKSVLGAIEKALT